jgi:recombination protein RecA
VVTRKGAWYSYEGDNIGQGRDNTIGWLEQNPEAKDAIEVIVRQKLTEGSEVTSNSMRPLAAAARSAAAKPSAKPVDTDKKSAADGVA